MAKLLRREAFAIATEPRNELTIRTSYSSSVRQRRTVLLLDFSIHEMNFEYE
jgi:hypothetical protein